MCVCIRITQLNVCLSWELGTVNLILQMGKLRFAILLFSC